MRLVLPLLAALVLAAPVRAATSNGDPTTRAAPAFTGSADDTPAPTRIGVLPFTLVPLLTVTASAFVVASTVWIAGEATAASLPGSLAALRLLLTFDVLFAVPVSLAVYGLERLLTGVDRPWWLGPLLTPVADLVAVLLAGLLINGLTAVGGPTTGTALALPVAAVAFLSTHVALQTLAFGPPVAFPISD